jgi:hypothetical protein
MTEKKSELIKNVMINLGILFVLVSTTTSKNLGLGFFFLGLILLGLQTLELKTIEPKKRITAEMIIAAITQLAMSKSFGSPQVFMIILLLGGLLITIEAVRKYADM